MWDALPQNFNYNTVIFPKSRRMIALTRLLISPIIWGRLIVLINSRSTCALTHLRTIDKQWLYKHFFIPLFWSHLKSIIISNEGLQVNTLTRSYTYYSLNKYRSLINKLGFTPFFKPSLFYLKPVLMIFSSFSKNSFNRVLTLTVAFITSLSFAVINLWTCRYNYLFLSNNFLLLNFLNTFYLKIHTY